MSSVKIIRSDKGLRFSGSGNATALECSFIGQMTYGVEIAGGGTVDARRCWWGHPTGPSGEGPGRGSAVSTKVLYDPWLRYSVPESDVLLGKQDDRCGSSADPVNTATGNFTQEETDLSIATRAAPLQFSRFYNSKDRRDSPLGFGWTHSWYIELNDQAPGGQVSVRWGDGRTDYWIEHKDDGYVPSVPNLFDKLVKNPNKTWTLMRKNLDVYEFDTSGRLNNITDKNGNTFALAYDDQRFPDRVTRIRKPAGRSLALVYNDDGLLESVTDFANPPRTVRYGYTDGRLTRVTDTLGNPIRYGYDENGYLATITDQRGVTTVTNIYDGEGRVVEQRDGNNNITTFEWDTPQENQTTITRTVMVEGEPQPRVLKTIHTHDPLYKLLLSIENPIGHKTTYTYDDLYNLSLIHI